MGKAKRALFWAIRIECKVTLRQSETGGNVIKRNSQLYSFFSVLTRQSKYNRENIELINLSSKIGKRFA